MFKLKKFLSVILCLLLAGGISTAVVQAETKTKFSLSKSKVTLRLKKSFHIKSKGKAKVRVNIVSGNADKKLIVKSDSKIIKISKINDYDYKVKALKKGTATILVKTEGSGSAAKLTVKIKNKKKPVGVIEITSDNFKKEVLDSKSRVIVDFSTEWCYYCQLLKPIFDEASLKTSKYKFCHIDVQKQTSLAIKYGVATVPTLLVYENGKVTKNGGYSDGLTADKLIEWIGDK